MARILVVGSRWDVYGLHGAALEPLRTLGIDAVPAALNGSSLSIAGSTFNANSAEARQFLNTFDAIFVLERRGIDSNVNALDQALNSWLTWNEPSDKPIVYFAPNLSTARTSLSLPSDFPLIRPDPSNLSATTELLDPNTWQVPSGLQFQTHYSRLGGRFRLTREQVSVYTPAACAFLGTNAYFWKLDVDQHWLLGANGEILAYPDFPDRAFEIDVVVAYRYRNRYFFPFIWEDDIVFRRDMGSTDGVSLFWLVYALKCLGIQPTRQAILCIEIDHPIEEKHNRPLDNQTRDDQYAILHRTYEWLTSFCRQTGLVVPCGFTNGGRSRTSAYHFYYVQNYPASRAINDLLRQSGDVLPNGAHDHTYTWGAQGGNFVRASTANVPVEYGVPDQNWALVNPKVAPNSIRRGSPRTLDGFYNIGARMSGTETTVSNLTNLCEYTALMVLEDEFDEMRALGFADGHCGVHRYTNEAANSTGGEGYWKALIAMGFRGIRRTYDPRANFPSDRSLEQVLPGVARGYRYRGLQFVHSRVLDWFVGNNGSYGLYRVGTSDTAVGVYMLDLGGTDLTDYATNAATRWKVYRRIIGDMVGLWLVQALYFRGTVYVHPQGWFGASVSDPTGVVDTGSDLKVNPIVELLKAMREVQQVLSDYLKFGSPSEVMDVLESVGA